MKDDQLNESNESKEAQGISEDPNNTSQDQKTVSDNLEERTRTGLPESRTNKKSTKLLVIAGFIGVIVFLVLPGYLGRHKDADNVDVQKKEPDKVTVKKKDDFKYNQSDKPENKLFANLDEKKDPEPAPQELLGAPPSSSESTGVEPAPAKPKLIKGIGNFRVGGNGEGSTSDSESVEKDANTKLVESYDNKTDKADKNDDIFRAPVFSSTKAKKSPYNPHLLLSKGTMIQCVLRTKLVSNVSGQVSCVVADNVYSASGAVLLIEKGSRVNGFYQHAAAEHGSNEIFAVWQEIRTPNNLVIPVESGSTDELGANGLRGWADQHFWERFENAILLSMIKDVSGAISSRASKRDGQDYGENTRDAAQDVAEKILDQMGDIKPTIYKNQGDKVGIFVARDVDFSDVYQLRLKRR